MKHFRNLSVICSMNSRMKATNLIMGSIMLGLIWISSCKHDIPEPIVINGGNGGGGGGTGGTVTILRFG
ncbi:MAG: hypothetical protein IPN36_18650 [Bacteroidetes bacterium]|nr:hypothetical protein [Bacteroidota bacterium]